MDTIKTVTARYVTIQHPNGNAQRYTWKGMERAATQSKLYAKLLSEARAKLST